jgi:capsular exopolysaccharide synthesis family protein
MVREIERQQTIKETLYVLLLTKREEAAVNLAITSPSIKVVDYAITREDLPVAPKKKIIAAIALLLGLGIPFAVVYLINMLDTKIHDRTDVEKANPEIPVVAEIPFIEGGGMFLDPGDRSALAESFRILATNAEYMVGKRKPGKGKVIYVTSTIKGEGKTFVSLNMSLAFASVKKKVLLVGADLRNPQLHTYFDINKSHIKGLSNYLHNPDVSLDDCITEGFGINEYHKICFSGIIPPNAPQLLAGDAFEKFLEEAKAEFDYVIVDLAPTLLVTDTLIVSRFADETVYVTKANHTDKKLLEYSKELNAKGKLRNMAYVVNGVGQSGSGRYGYGYTYNYGYGYGYNTDSEVKTKKNIFQKIFKK